MKYKLNKNRIFLSILISILLSFVERYWDNIESIKIYLYLFINILPAYCLLFFVHFIRHKKFIKNTIIQYNSVVGQIYYFYKIKLKFFIKRYKYIIIELLIIFLIIFINPLINLLKHSNTIAEWLSGIGSLSAAIVALKVSKHREPPKIKHFIFINPKSDSIVIQFVNYSEASDFIRLNSIVANNMGNTKPNAESIPNNLLKYVRFNPLKSNGVITISISKKSKLIKNFLLQNIYNDLRFNFDDTNNKYYGSHSVDIYREDLLNN